MNAPVISPTQLLLLTFAGVVGVLLRFAIDQLALRFSLQPHIATFGINVLGCFLAGALYSLTVNKGLLSVGAAQVLLVGLCGGFTTFSAYALQTLTLMQTPSGMTAVVYLTLSPIVELAACAGGYFLFR